MPKVKSQPGRTSTRATATKTTSAAAARSKKGPKASHLYTDDNPATTLHGTGFKDAATAKHTINLVSKRSLTYQFQTINTMLYRAKGHPHKTANMMDAIEILQAWVNAYPDKKAELRVFKLLPKDVVGRYMKFAEDRPDLLNKEDAVESGVDRFAKLYVSLENKKRLANVLVDPTRPAEEDWEVKRYKFLCGHVSSERVEDLKTYPAQLWKDNTSREPTPEHLVMILWGYSPLNKLS